MEPQVGVAGPSGRLNLVAGLVISDEVVVAAETLSVDEDLGDCFAAAGESDEFAAHGVIVRHVDLFEGYVLGSQEFFSGVAVRTGTCRVDEDFFGHA